MTSQALLSCPGEIDKKAFRREITSHAIRRMQAPERDRPILDAKLLRAIWETGQLPRAQEQADNLILYLGRVLNTPDDQYPSRWDAWGSIIGAGDVTKGVPYILNQVVVVDQLCTCDLSDRNLQALARGEAPFPGFFATVKVGLTFAGWKRLDDLQRSVSESRTAFMAMKFGRATTDRLFRDYLKPAVAQTGFELLRLDERPKPGLIDLRMELEIRRSKFIVADLTHGNRGAYWEAGFAAGLGKPAFFMCEAERFRRVGTHFDTNHHYTIKWTADNMQNAADELKTAIRTILPADAKMADT